MACSDAALMQSQESAIEPTPTSEIVLNNQASPLIAETYKRVTAFSDGVAWVLFESNQLWHLINKTGDVLLRLDDMERPYSLFSNGVALIQRIDNTIELINKSGDTVSSPKMGEYDIIEGFLLDIGMIIVSQRIESFELSTVNVGIINNRGDWQVEFNTDLADILSMIVHLRPEFAQPMPSSSDAEQRFREARLLDSSGVIIARTSMQVNFDLSYIGEGMFLVKRYWNLREEATIINILTRDSTIINRDYERHYYLTRELTLINNGYGVFKEAIPASVGRVVTNYDLYSVDTAGRINTIFTEFGTRGGILGDYHEGLFFFSNFENLQGFFDIDGNLAIDLSEYTIAFHFQFPDPQRYIWFNGGYALLYLDNPQGVEYFTVIDKNGNMMFDPLLNIYESHGIIVDGMIVIRKESGLTGSGRGDKAVIINPFGEIVAEFESAHITDFNEGVAVVTIYENRSYGDIVEQYHIDKNGNRLFNS
jgi:hypothetical protein